MKGYVTIETEADVFSDEYASDMSDEAIRAEFDRRGLASHEVDAIHQLKLSPRFDSEVEEFAKRFDSWRPEEIDALIWALKKRGGR